MSKTHYVQKLINNRIYIVRKVWLSSYNIARYCVFENDLWVYTANSFKGALKYLDKR